jgi:alginate O-acetyltransferase complex protein AlgI
MTPALNYIAAFVLIFAGTCVRAPKLRQVLLLAGSYVFYAGAGAGFLAVLIASSVLNFILGELLRRRLTVGRLWLGVIANVLLLGFFKYLPPLASGASTDFLHRIVMPVGMSFWTFQALSYLFDIFREEEIEPTLVEFCLYMSFWPTVLMGPICRLPKMLPQFRQVRGISSSDLVAGLYRITTGLFTKLVLAQFLGTTLVAVSKVGKSLDGIHRTWGGFDVWIIAIGFGFQLFFDFAGYSHIVIGAARVFGFRLEENFESPYLSSTPSNFWTRWHMSLSSWIRDYVFVPMATARREPWWRYFALLVSMVLFGLWHGATLTFLLWGAYHGIFLMLHRIVQLYKQRFRIPENIIGSDLFAWIITFLGISLSWILFRTSDLHEALSMFHAVLSPASYLHMFLPANCYQVVLASAIGYFAYCHLDRGDWVGEQWRKLFAASGDVSESLSEAGPLSLAKRWWWRGPAIATLAILTLLVAAYQASQATPFIYALF